MTFQHAALLPWSLFALAAAGFIFLCLARIRARHSSRFRPSSSGPRWLFPWTDLPLLLIPALLLLALSGPEWGREATLEYASGSDFLFIVDVSPSMDATDAPPTRLRTAEYFSLSLLREFPGSGAGLVVFAGDAEPLCPVTGDTDLVKRLFASLKPSPSRKAGTDMARAFEVLTRMTTKRDPSRNVTLVFLTDGEAFRSPEQSVVTELRRRGLHSVVAGIGTPGGAPVPPPPGRTQAPGGARTRLDEDKLRALASDLGGTYIHVETPLEDARRVRDSLGEPQGERFTVSWHARARHREMVLPVLALLALWLAGSLPRRTRMPALAGLLLCLLTGCASPPARERADALVQARQYTQAVPLYQQALRVPGPDPSRLHLNLSGCLVFQGNPDEAARQATAGLQVGAAPSMFRSLLFNLGCAHMTARRDREAIEAFRHLLEKDPKDRDARINLEICLRRQPAPPPPPDPESPPPPSQPPPPDDRLLDSLRDQEQTPPPSAERVAPPSGGPYW